MMYGKSLLPTGRVFLLLRSEVVSDCASKEGNCRLGRLNLNFQSKVCCGPRRNVSQTGDRDSREYSAEILSIEELSKILDCRSASESDAVGAARKHRSHTPS